MKHLHLLYSRRKYSDRLNQTIYISSHYVINYSSILEMASQTQPLQERDINVATTHPAAVSESRSDHVIRIDVCMV